MPPRSIVSVPEDDVRAAIAASNLGGLAPAAIAQLTVGTRSVSVPAGSTIHHVAEASPHLEIVVTGLVRVFVIAADGRTMTVRYCRPGALIGVATLYVDRLATSFATQALVDSQLLALRPDVVLGSADRDVRVARALLTETSQRVLGFVAEISGSAFTTVRQRVARHLLDLASERQRGSELVARVSQQELADAVGSVREVVVRVLRELREEDVLQTGRFGITVRDPDRLVGLAQTGG